MQGSSRLLGTAIVGALHRKCPGVKRRSSSKFSLKGDKDLEFSIASIRISCKLFEWEVEVRATFAQLRLHAFYCHFPQTTHVLWKKGHVNP